MACPSILDYAHLSDNTIGMSGVAIPTGDTALCSKPVRLLETSSGHKRILKALVPSAPPAALCAWYRWRFSFSACRRATYCGHELVHHSNVCGTPLDLHLLLDAVTRQGDKIKAAHIKATCQICVDDEKRHKFTSGGSLRLTCTMTQ